MCIRDRPPAAFPPATKAESGHDENITTAPMASVVGDATARELEGLSRAIYDFACRTAEPRGIIIADTKFEFGQVNGHTPVSYTHLRLPTTDLV